MTIHSILPEEARSPTVGWLSRTGYHVFEYEGSGEILVGVGCRLQVAGQSEGCLLPRLGAAASSHVTASWRLLSIG